MKRIVYIFLLLAYLSIAACNHSKTIKALGGGDTISMQYAELLTLVQYDGYIHAQIRNPWKEGNILHSYILVPKDADLPSNLPKGDVVRTPLDNSVLSTSVHISLINQLGAYDCVSGLCDVKYMKLPKIKSDLASGKLRDLGEGSNPNIEAIIDLSPEAILLSPFQSSGSYGRLGKLGIPLIECADYMETSSLGRAEWMRFYGLLFGKMDEADKMFAGVASRYNDLKGLARKARRKPTVIVDFKYGTSWFVPGGNSTVGRLLDDAGTDYIFKDTKESGSIAMDPEVVFDASINAEYWLVKYTQDTDKTYDEIKADYVNYSKMTAFTAHNIYGCNLAHSNFYEETPFHPDILLKDYIAVFHPELLSNYRTKYYKKICEK